MTTEARPQLPADWDLTKVIPGEVVDAAPADADEPEDDIAPGVIEVRPYRRPVLYQAGGAAMVVASVTGRMLGLSARGTWMAAGWFGHGLKSSCVLGYRYARAHDLQEVLGGMSNSGHWNKVEIVRRKRWWTLGWTAGATAALNLAGWWALVKFGGLTALDWSWTVTPAFTGLVAGTLLTLYGRYRLNSPSIAPEQIIADPDNPDSDEPFPLAMCQSPGQVEECVSRALAHKGIGTRSVQVLGYRGWGWELDVVLNASKPAAVSAVLDDLDALFDIPQGGTMFETDPQRAAHLTMRLVQSDPFADMARPSIHAPHSLSVHDNIVMGRAMDGSTFELTLDGFCALIIGAMGAGKTLGALRTVAEALTACIDAVCWDLDPLKGGLDEFGDLMELRARDPKACEEALERALKFVTARSKVMARLKMGDRWKASAKHPHLYIFIDEFLQLSPRGKERAIQLLRTGRQYGIYLIFAGQEATEDALGDAIAGIVPFRIGMACRFEDIRLLFGPGKGAVGWRPDRLEPAVGEIVNDAGQSFIMGGGFNRAIRHRFNGFTRDQILEAVPARIKAGANRLDADTLLEAGEGLTAGSQRRSLTEQLAEFARETMKEDAITLHQLLKLFDDKGADWLPTAVIVEFGVAADGGELQGLLDSLVANAVSRRDYAGDRRVRGWDREIVEQAASVLIAPS
ncbi:hypothetical protein DT019_03045 [Streptomyces sp. SDr-06]|uniref:hypothetical protein n=1 Tax=Streptomyces sp. SDr-06 TaxID=2267702 RepID=UPI000DE98A66|nr:hypothetical protein [Streptomyces sp. SDr-06]RCH70480.1 hypothetical protein DT019_03045 [Streptomyces sp. SDr-06]